MTTMEDIKKRGGKCSVVATDFWECTDKDGTVWWCSDGGKACTEKPMTKVCEKEDKDILMSIKGLEKEGAKCKQRAEDLWICHHPDGKVWSCQGRREDSSCIIIHDPDEKNPEKVIDRLTFFEEQLIATLPHPDAPDEKVEIIYQKKKGTSSGGGTITVCEVCITTIDSGGNRTTACSPIPCPKNQILGPIGQLSDYFD